MQQPFATWIAVGLKQIERRSWPSKHRGPLLICASRREDREAMNLAYPDGAPRGADNYPLGVALAIVYMNDCRPMIEADEHAAAVPAKDGHWAWVFAPHPARVKPFHVTGYPGIFEVEVPSSVLNESCGV